MTSTAHGADQADEINLALLMIAWPQFAITVLPGSAGPPRWQIQRRNGAVPGLYCLISRDLTEVYNALMADSPPAVPGPAGSSDSGGTAAPTPPAPGLACGAAAKDTGRASTTTRPGHP